MKNSEEPASVTPIIRFCEGWGTQLDGRFCYSPGGPLLLETGVRQSREPVEESNNKLEPSRRREAAREGGMNELVGHVTAPTLRVRGFSFVFNGFP